MICKDLTVNLNSSIGRVIQNEVSIVDAGLSPYKGGFMVNWNIDTYTGIRSKMLPIIFN
jgi:hypothetical protein